MRSPREEAAHRYADAAGWPVLALSRAGNGQFRPHGFKEATTSHRQIEQWWRDVPNANIGIATGAPGPDVLDVDVHKGGTGYGPLRELKQAGLVPEPMAIIRTPSSGAHLYYRGTEQRNGHLSGKHLDYRGQGGYVVASPSRIAGRDYEVVKHQPSVATFDWSAASSCLHPEPERQPYRPPERQARNRPRDLSPSARVGRQPARGQPQSRLVLGSAGLLRLGTQRPWTAWPAQPGPPGWMSVRSAGRSPRRSRPPDSGGRSFEHPAPAAPVHRPAVPAGRGRGWRLSPAHERAHHGVAAPGGSSIRPPANGGDLMPVNTTTPFSPAPPQPPRRRTPTRPGPRG